MYTIYSTGDIVFWKPNGTVASVWTSDGLHCNEYGLASCNFLTKAIVHATRWTIITLDKILKAESI